jgi:spore germination cell wall hydrolase CwlJ-like protein
MQFSSLRGALTAAAMMLVTLCGAAPGAAREAPVAAATPALGGTPPAALVRAATSPATAQAPAMSGSAWIAQGTVVPTSPAQPTAAAKPIAMALATGALHVDSLMELVGDMPVDPALSPDLKCLAQAIYFEARGEPIEGQLAVAEVVINRAKSGLYPDNYCDVITQPAQFSFVRRGQIPEADEGSAAWQRAEAIAEIAEQNLWRSKASGALYFHATYVRPSWARQKVELAQIDTHIFYR